MAKFRPFAKSQLSRRSLFKGAAALAASGVAAKWLADGLVEGGEAPTANAVGHPGAARAVDFIDVREFKKRSTVEQLNSTAEHYFASVRNWDYLLAKPLSDIEGAPDLLNNFASVLSGLQLLPGMTVLDFGAGSCWASRWLTQMGMEAIALDVSQTALKIGQALYARLPVIGDRPPPRFLGFDGHRIELADASVDRILCLDTFHHLLNQDEVLREMSRVLKPGGIAGFSEPGPHHSLSAQSQYEMRNYGVLEDDVDIREVWSAARKAGFVRMRLAVFSPRPLMLSLDEFEDFLEAGTASQRYAVATRAQMEDRRMFFLQNGGTPVPVDSRSRAGLAASLEVTLESTTVTQGASLVGRVVVTNRGRAIWLPPGSEVGAVSLGCHLLDASGKMLDVDFFRHPLTPGAGRPVRPGETLTFDMRVPSPKKGAYILEFDLVSEKVSWFALNGSQIVRLSVQVN